MFFVYILRCADNTFYVGHNDDLNSRIALHNWRRFWSDYTASRRPVVLAHSETFTTREQAHA